MDVEELDQTSRVQIQKDVFCLVKRPASQHRRSRPVEPILTAMMTAYFHFGASPLTAFFFCGSDDTVRSLCLGHFPFRLVELVWMHAHPPDSWGSLPLSVCTQGDIDSRFPRVSNRVASIIHGCSYRVQSSSAPASTMHHAKQYPAFCVVVWPRQRYYDILAPPKSRYNCSRLGTGPVAPTQTQTSIQAYEARGIAIRIIMQ